ncbi:MAG: hypothetical protein HY731_06240 [Candidatus Tectomicrobia bacterium]|nr:hypothetical protein [Candidatus Tectomicrobia bacterium]
MLCLWSNWLQAATITGRVIEAGKESVIDDAAIWVEKVGEPMIFQPPTKPAQMKQKNLSFSPSLLPILVGATVEFPNEDTVYHHIYSFSKPKRFDLGLYKPGESRSALFDKTGVVKVFCNIHDFMTATILVLSSPYFATTDEKGVCPPQRCHNLRSRNGPLRSVDVPSAHAK